MLWRGELLLFHHWPIRSCFGSVILLECLDFSDEDGVRAAELEGEFAELGGWEAESEASQLLQNLNIPEELHDQNMSELANGEKVKVLPRQSTFW